MEICKGKNAEQKEYMQEPEMKAGTAMVLRLTKPWYGSSRMVVGNSYFASVQTAVECWKKDGLYFHWTGQNFMQDVSKNSMPDCSYAEGTQRGSTVLVKSGVQMMAHVWNDPGKPGKPRKALISEPTCGTTLQ